MFSNNNGEFYNEIKRKKLENGLGGRKRTKVTLKPRLSGSYAIPPQSKDTIHTLLKQKSVLLHILVIVLTGSARTFLQIENN